MSRSGRDPPGGWILQGMPGPTTAYNSCTPAMPLMDQAMHLRPAGTLAVLTAIVTASGGEFGALLAPFSPFTAIWYLVDPAQLFDTSQELAKNYSATRMAVAMGTLAAAAVYGFAVWTAYMGLVRNFDMIVRKQSGT